MKKQIVDRARCETIGENEYNVVWKNHTYKIKLITTREWNLICPEQHIDVKIYERWGYGKEDIIQQIEENF